jgi:hypothetical protein
MGNAASSSAEIQIPFVTGGKVGPGGVGVNVGVTIGGRITKGTTAVGVGVTVGTSVDVTTGNEEIPLPPAAFGEDTLQAERNNAKLATTSKLDF